MLDYHDTYDTPPYDFFHGNTISVNPDDSEFESPPKEPAQEPTQPPPPPPKEPTQPTQEPTQEPTQPAKEPTQEPAQEPTQPSSLKGGLRGDAPRLEALLAVKKLKPRLFTNNVQTSKPHEPPTPIRIVQQLKNHTLIYATKNHHLAKR